MALGAPVFGTVAYSAASGASVAPAYPTNTTGDQLILVIGQKPSAANGGTVTTPTNWTLVTSITGQGGYGTTLGADTGNTNLFVYTRTAPSGGLSGTLTVTVGTNNVCWGIIGKTTPTAANGAGVLGWTASDATAGNVSAAFTTGTDVTAADQLIWAMCIPTDVTTPAQFSAHAVSATGVTFGTATEIVEPDSGNGNDIGGYLAYAAVSTGTSSGNTTVTATAGGTTTNVRGPLAMIRLRETPAPAGFTLTADGTTYALTGGAAGLSVARNLTADVASYSYTGQDVTLSLGKRMAAEGATYALTGGSATFSRGYALAAENGSYALTGSSVGLLTSRVLSASSGSYVLAGNDASFRLGKSVTLESGAYTYTGSDASLTRSLLLSAESGNYVYSGQDAAITYTPVAGYVLLAEAASYVMTFNDATLTYGSSTPVKVYIGATPLVGGGTSFSKIYVGTIQVF